MTATLNPTTDHRWYTVHHPAEKAYAAMCAVLVTGFAIVTVSGQPSAHVGRILFDSAALLFIIGAFLERSTRAAVGGLIALAFGNYLATYAAPGHHYSHGTLGAQLAAVAAVTVVGGWALARRDDLRGGFVEGRQAGRERAGR